MNDWIRGRVTAKKQWSDRLFSLQIDAAVGEFKAGQYTKVALDVGEERVGRPYSLVNAPDQRPLEIYFNEIPEGPLTPRLSDLSAGDPLWLAGKAGGIFTMDNVVPRKHLWLVATGTALGVYLSILRTEEPWDRFERVILVHGVRTADELTYSETIAAIKETRSDQFVFLPALSRDRQDDALHGRVTSLLASGALEKRAGVGIHPDDSHLMLCGNSEMIKDVRALLEARGLMRHSRRAPGHYTTEQYH